MRQGRKNYAKHVSLFHSKAGYAYIAVWFIGMVVLQIYPFIASLIYSFTDYSIVKNMHFVGLANFRRALFSDTMFYISLKATLTYVFFSVPFKLVFALFVAMLLNLKIRGVGLFRIFYYLPSILGGSVGIAILWRYLFNRHGYLNLILKNIGIGPIDFIGNPKLAIYTISLLSVWQFGSSMILFLAALKQIPSELLEAARIDGAGPTRVFGRITIPLITPTIFFNLIMQTISAFQQFQAPYNITNGGPMRSTYLYGLMLYENAFTNLHMGYACAQSWILFIIVLIFTTLVFKSSPYWTFYSDGGEF